jgi:3-isopropylmalate dehydrogenase
MEGIRSVVGEADLVIYRENTEGYYSDRNMFVGTGEWKVTPDIVISSGVFTRKAIERIAHASFKMAGQRRKKVTIVHKANVIKLGSGLFLDVCREVGQQYPEVEIDDYHIDAMAAHLVRRAKDFDVIVTENMFGDILSDLAGELVGSLGLAPSINSNDQQAMAQAAHGSAPDIAGKNIANPTGIMLSTVMFLDWLSVQHNDSNVAEIARIIENGLLTAVSDGVKTRDLGGSASTTEFTQAIIERLGV